MEHCKEFLQGAPFNWGGRESRVTNGYLQRQAVVGRTANYIERNFAEPLELSQVARVAGMSKFHLHRVFQEHVGTTLGRYLLRVRLRAALGLLRANRTNSMTILEIALRVGFENASAFTRSFQQRYGLTPSATRAGGTPRAFPLPGAVAPNADAGVVRLELPSFWAYGYEVGGFESHTFMAEAPAAFALARDKLARHGIEGVHGEFGLPNYSWVTPDSERKLLCGFRSARRLDIPHCDERLMAPGSWLATTHFGPDATRWQSWIRLKLLQLHYGVARDGREAFEEVVQRDADGTCIATRIYFPIEANAAFSSAATANDSETEQRQ